MNNSIVIHLWPPSDGLPSSSPYCIKVLKALEFKKLPYQIVLAKLGAPKWARHGMLPAAELKGQKVSDSTAILKALDKLYPDTPKLYPADAQLRAETLLLEEWADEWFSGFAPYYRWTIDRHFTPFAEQCFAAIPTAMRMVVVPLLRRSAVKQLKSDGIGLNTEEERIERFKEGLWLLEQRLAKKPYLVCDQPTAADFAVYPALAIIINGKLDELSRYVAASAPLTKWMLALKGGAQW